MVPLEFAWSHDASCLVFGSGPFRCEREVVEVASECDNWSTFGFATKHTPCPAIYFVHSCDEELWDSSAPPTQFLPKKFNECHPKRFFALISPQASIFADRTEKEVCLKPEQFDLIDTHVQFLQSEEASECRFIILCQSFKSNLFCFSFDDERFCFSLLLKNNSFLSLPFCVV